LDSSKSNEIIFIEKMIKEEEKLIILDTEVQLALEDTILFIQHVGLY